MPRLSAWCGHLHLACPYPALHCRGQRTGSESPTTLLLDPKKRAWWTEEHWPCEAKVLRCGVTRQIHRAASLLLCGSHSQQKAQSDCVLENHPGEAGFRNPGALWFLLNSCLYLRTICTFQYLSLYVHFPFYKNSHMNPELSCFLWIL